MVDQEMLAAIESMLDKKLDEKLDQKMKPINTRLDGIETRLDKLQDDVDALKEDSTITRAATNEILDFLEKASPVNGWKFPKAE